MLMRHVPFVIALASASSSATAAPASPVARAAVAEDLRYFIGTWRVRSRDPGTNQVVTVTYRVAPISGGRWLAGRGESADLSISVRDTWGVDPATEEVLRFVFDGTGAYGVVRSRGWAGNRLTLTGETYSKSGPTRVRETITRHGPNRFDAVWEAFVNGVWKPYAIEQARRR